jgi:3-oxoacyl-[acyl-carrier-protein] synthase-3
VSAPLYIHGIGHAHPPNVVTNAFLEELDIGTSTSWILEMLGIHERRTALSLEYIRSTRNADMRASLEALEFANVDAGYRAALMALERAAIDANQIGLVIAGSSCPVHTSPPESCIIADRLGLSVPAFDLHSACNGFLAHSSVAQGWLQTNHADYGLLIQCEHMTRTVDYRDRTNASIMGDATTAVVVSTRIPARLRLENITIGASTKHWKAAVVSPLRHFKQETTAVRRFAEGQFVKGIMAGEHRYVIFHQANLRLIQASFAQLNLPGCEHLYNVDRYGNCASAGCPSVISEHWDLILNTHGTGAVSTVGGGLTFGSAILRSSL